MRIRKRQVPLPFSSLSPVPLSDPLLHRTPVVQLQRIASLSPPKAPNPSHGGHTVPHVPLQPSDRANQRPPPAAGGTDGWDSADDASGSPDEDNGSEEDDGDEEEEGKPNDTRGGAVSGAEMRNGFVPDSSSCSSPVMGRWCEREKAFPLKKRRGSFERREKEDNHQHHQVAVSVMEKKTMKTKMNKKCTQKEEDEEHVSSGAGKKRARGGALMEGSRCSRVNGRGWRCCQQTLVGYSLCEHHLGKGRLRSMNSVRSRPPAANNPAKKEPPEKDQKEAALAGKEEDERKPLMAGSKKRVKLGVVKARSISSLLGQMDGVTPAPATDAADNK